MRRGDPHPAVIASRVIGGAAIPNLLSSRAALLAARRSAPCCHREPRYWRRGDPHPAVIASRVIGGAAIPNPDAPSQSIEDRCFRKTKVF
jgi:hypothetical protein